MATTGTIYVDNGDGTLSVYDLSPAGIVQRMYRAAPHAATDIYGNTLVGPVVLYKEKRGGFDLFKGVLDPLAHAVGTGGDLIGYDAQDFGVYAGGAAIDPGQAILAGGVGFLGGGAKGALTNLHGEATKEASLKGPKYVLLTRDQFAALLHAIQTGETTIPGAGAGATGTGA